MPGPSSFDISRVTSRPQSTVSSYLCPVLCPGAPVHELLQGASLLPLSQCPGHSEPAPDTESAPRPPGLPPAPLRSDWHRCTSKCWRHLCPVLRLAQSVTVLCFSLVSLISSLHHCSSHWTVPTPLLVSLPSGASYGKLPEASS